MNKNTEWTQSINAGGTSLVSRITELFQYRDLVRIFVYRDLVSRYKQTLLGPAWILIQPILFTVIYTVVFGGIVGIDTNGVPHILFYLCGMTFWGFFSSNLQSISDVFHTNAHLFSKVYFPRFILIISTTISNLLIFCVQLVILMAIWIYLLGFSNLDTPVIWIFIYISFCTALLALLSIGLGLIFASSTIKYRDLRHLTPPILQILLYGSAVLYPLSLVNGLIKEILQWNPLVHLFEAIRNALFFEGPALSSLGYPLVFTTFVFVISVVYFSSAEKNFIDTI